MSIEIILYPERGSREELTALLLELGYRRTTGHFLLRQSEYISYFAWFDEDDFKSITGVEANIIPGNDPDKEPIGEWVVHTRTHMSAGYWDQKKQDETIRTIRKHFGGDFFNDHAGKNRYINPENDPRDPLGRGIYTYYANISDKIDKVVTSLPKEWELLPDADETNPLIATFKKEDPSRVVYNVLVAFAVAALEAFFNDVFILMLRYDPKSKRKIADQNKRLEIAEVMELLEGDLTIEEVIAKWYSFQNLKSINQAYTHWHGIDIFKALSSRKRIAKKVKPLHQHFQDLIERRHAFIHHFGFDSNLDRAYAEELFRLVKLIMKTMIEYYEQEKGIQIWNEEYGWYFES